ncbi:hypothetical protein ACFSTD_20205 [Novosphingobium colocasiae]
MSRSAVTETILASRSASLTSSSFFGPGQRRIDRIVAFGKLDVTGAVAPADEADHVAADPLDHGCLRLLLKLRAHSPVERKRADEIEEARGRSQPEALIERGCELVCPGDRTGHFEHQRIGTAAKAQHQHVIARPGRRKRETKAEQRHCRAQIAGLFAHRLAVIGRSHLELARSRRPGPADRFGHRHMRQLRRFDPGRSAGFAHHRHDDFRHRDVAHEALFISVRGRVIDRGVAIDQIVRVAGITGQPGRPGGTDTHGRRAIAIGELRCAAGLGQALFLRQSRFHRVPPAGHRAAR